MFSLQATAVDRCVFYPEQYTVSLTSQDRKTNVFVQFLGESAAQQFCLEIYFMKRAHHSTLLEKTLIKADPKQFSFPFFSAERVSFYFPFSFTVFQNGKSDMMTVFDI